MSTVIDSLVSAINNAVKANGNKEITGNILQVVLDNMVGTLTQINGLLNVNQVNSKSTAYASASDARQDVPDNLKTEGLVIAYKLSSGWIIEQNKDISGTWTSDSSWQTVGPVSVLQNTSTGTDGNGKIIIGGTEDGRYAGADKVIGLVGIALSLDTSGISAVDDVYFDTHYNKFFRCTNWTGDLLTSDYVEIPPYKGAIYSYNNVLYTWDFTNNKLIPYVTMESSQNLDGFDLSVNGETIKGVLGGYQKGLYYQGTNVDNINYNSVVSDTDNIFVQIVENGCRHISKIRYVAKTGTIYFYKVYAPLIGNGLKVSKTLITSVVNESSEANTIKTIDVDIDLLENEYLGISGDFKYKNTSGNNTFYFNASTNTIGGTSNTQAFAIMTISDVNGLSKLLEKREFQFLDTYGENGVGDTTSTPGFVFINEDSQKNYPTILRYIEVELGANNPTEIYKVTLNGDNSTVELLGSAKGSGTVLIPLNVTLLPNQRIGIGNRIRYANSGADERYSYKYLSSSGGAVTQQPAGSIVCYKLYGIIPDTTKKDTTIIVDANGDGDYTNIHDAIKGTYGMDSSSNPIHIKVMPGIYNEPTLPFAEESLYCNDRFLSIVGVDKENCIVRNDKGYYNGSASGVDNYGDNAPIKVNGNVYIANLTIISTDDEAESEDNVYHRSYCIHTDAGANQNTTLEIHNCILKNNHAPCVGFGIPQKNTLKITNCELYADMYNINDWASDGAVIWGHDRRSQASTEIDEHLFIKDCVIKSDNTNAVVFVNNKSGLSDCIFINNAVDVPSGMGIDLDTGTSIDKLSFGNALTVMNYPN